MGHYSALVFTTQNIDEKMERFYFDYEFGREFNEEMDVEEAKREFERIINNPENFRNDLNKFLKYKKEGYASYFEEECGHTIDEYGSVGYTSNPDGFYDWYEVGGRWNNELPLKDGTMVNDAPVDLVDIDKLIEAQNIFCAIDIYDEYEHFPNSKKEYKKQMKQLFEIVKGWQELNGEQVQVWLIDYHS